MSVAGITSDGDWTFGRGKSSYKTKSEEIKQNVLTRIKCFKNDSFLDMSFGIDWKGLTTSSYNANKLEAAIETMIVETVGVASVDSIYITKIDRTAKVSITYTDIYNKKFNINEGI